MLTDMTGFKWKGDQVTIWPMAKVVFPERIWVGDHVIIDDFVFIVPGQELVIGSYVHIASFTSVTGGGPFVIEDFGGLSGGCRIYTGSEDFTGAFLTNPTVPSEFRHVTRDGVRIGRHAILGANVVVLPGVTIGEGASVGANSLVMRDLEPWTVNAGTPARPLKARPRDQILALERQLMEKYGPLPPIGVIPQGPGVRHDAA